MAKYNLFSLQMKRTDVTIGDEYKFNRRYYCCAIRRPSSKTKCLYFIKYRFISSHNRKLSVIAQKWILIKRRSRCSIVSSYAAYIFVGIV